MFVIKYRKIWYALSAILIALSFYGIAVYGFRLSVDFRGGTLTEVRYEGGRPDKADVEAHVEANNFGGFSVRPTGDTGYIIRTRELTPDEKQLLETSLNAPGFTAVIARETTIGPTAGTELARKAIIAVVIVLIMIVLFITFAFRKVSKPVSSWKYGLATILALSNDVIIPTGIFVFLGHLYGVEIDLLFVTGLLAILGYSVHDTIVVFDRVREHLRDNQNTKTNEPFDITVGKSLRQTLGRSINTSLTIFITLLALYLIGSPATKDFALLLLIGVVAGTYSSIFLASPLLVTFHKLQKK
jgi:preprotein translocase subunit SecF